MNISHNKLVNQKNIGFTIVELLVVIVVIGILAAITLVSYRGITARANETVLTADLANAKKQLSLYFAENNTYPTKLDNNNCPSTPKPDTNYCLKPGSGITLEYNIVSPTDFNLRATKGNLTYTTTANTSPTDDANNWITIGTQKWAKTNLNIGTMVTGVTNQTNNSILEKYCYNNDEANCTIGGGLYQWNEAMGYVTTEGAQGVCPAGSHIPTDNDWKILEVQLGMTQAQADATSWRGTDQGTKLKPGGASGLNVPLAGYRLSTLSFYGLSTDATLWSSSVFTTNVWYRYLNATQVRMNRFADIKEDGYSVRCLGN